MPPPQDAGEEPSSYHSGTLPYHSSAAKHLLRGHALEFLTVWFGVTVHCDRAELTFSIIENNVQGEHKVFP